MLRSTQDFLYAAIRINSLLNYFHAQFEIRT